MALTHVRNSLLLLAGVRRAYGETEPTPEQQEQADQAATIVRFDWEPGNGTLYRLTYTIRQSPVIPDAIPGGREAAERGDTLQPSTFYCLIWQGAILEDGRQLPPSAGRSFSWDQYSHLKGPWFASQMGINHADADGLLLLLDALGHSISYCNDDPTRTIPQPRTPVLVEEMKGADNATR